MSDESGRSSIQLLVLGPKQNNEPGSTAAVASRKFETASSIAAEARKQSALSGENGNGGGAQVAATETTPGPHIKGGIDTDGGRTETGKDARTDDNTTVLAADSDANRHARAGSEGDLQLPNPLSGQVDGNVPATSPLRPNHESSASIQGLFLGQRTPNARTGSKAARRVLPDSNAPSRSGKTKKRPTHSERLNQARPRLSGHHSGVGEYIPGYRRHSEASHPYALETGRVHPATGAQHQAPPKYTTPTTCMPGADRAANGPVADDDINMPEVGDDASESDDTAFNGDNTPPYSAQDGGAQTPLYYIDEHGTVFFDDDTHQGAPDVTPHSSRHQDQEGITLDSNGWFHGAGAHEQVVPLGNSVVGRPTGTPDTRRVTFTNSVRQHDGRTGHRPAPSLNNAAPLSSHRSTPTHNAIHGATGGRYMHHGVHSGSQAPRSHFDAPRVEHGHGGGGHVDNRANGAGQIQQSFHTDPHADRGTNGGPHWSQEAPRVHTAYRTTGFPTADTEGCTSNRVAVDGQDPFAEQVPYIAVEHGGNTGGVVAPNGPAWIHGLDFALSDQYEIWPFKEYPEPGRSENTGRGTRRFRLEGNATDATSKDFPNMAKAFKHQIAAQFPCIPTDDLVIMPPFRLSRWIFIDVVALTRVAYTEIASADVKPFQLAYSGAPFPANQTMLRVNHLDIRNSRVDVLNSMRSALASCGRIIAFWPMFRRDTIIGGAPTQWDFTGTVYALLACEGNRLDTNRLPTFLTFADLPYPKRVPLLFDGRPENCKQCKEKVSSHLAKDCPQRKCKCGGNHTPQNCPRKPGRSRRPAGPVLKRRV